MEALVPHNDEYAVRWFSSARQIPSDLWSLCFPPPLEGLWWYRALERGALASQFRFVYGLIEKDGGAIGIAPCFLMDFTFDMVPSRWLQRVLSFIGRCLPSFRAMRILFIGSPCSAHGTIGLIPGSALADVLPALLDSVRHYAARNGATVVVFKDVPESYSEAFAPCMGPGGLAKVVSYPGTCLSLNQNGFAGYLRSLNASHRYKVRRKLALSREAVDLRAEVVCAPGAGVLRDIFGLYQGTYEKARIKFERLTPDFFRAMAGAEASSFVLLREKTTDRLVAFMLCLQLGYRVVNKFVGLDYDLPRNAFVYFRLYEHAIEWASRAAATEFWSGQNSYAAKIELGHRLVPLYNYFQHSSPLLHRLFALAARRMTFSRLDEDLRAYTDAHPEWDS